MPGCLRSPLSALVFTVLLPVLASAQDGTWHHIPLGENPFFPDSVPRYQRKYASDTSGNVFAASDARIFRAAGGEVEDISPELPPGRVIHSLVADPAGIPWIGVGYREYWLNAETKAGWSLHRRVGGAWATVPHGTCGAGEYLHPLGIDSAGRLLLTSLKLGNMALAPSVQSLHRAGPAGCVEIPIPQRTDGSLRIGGYARGPDGAEYLHGTLAAGDIIMGGFLWELRSGAVQILNDTLHSIGPLIALPGRIVANTNSGLAIFQEGRVSRIDTIQGKPFRNVDGLFQDSRGVIWVPHTHWDSGRGSARILRIDGRDTTFHGTPLGQNSRLTVMVEDGGGNVWFHAQDGELLIYSPTGTPWTLAIRAGRPSSRFRPGIRGAAAGSHDALGRTAPGRSLLRIFRPPR